MNLGLKSTSCCKFGWNLILYSPWGKKKKNCLEWAEFLEAFLNFAVNFPPPLYSAWHACFIPLGTEGRHNPQAPPVFWGARFSPLSRSGPESFFWLTHRVLTATGVLVQGRVPDLGARACVSCTWRIPARVQHGRPGTWRSWSSPGAGGGRGVCCVYSLQCTGSYS